MANHGGKRVGAGGKPVLDWTAETWIGYRCENKFNAIWRQKLKDKEAADLARGGSLGTGDIRDTWARAENVPVNERVQWLKSQEGSDYLDDVEGDRKVLAGIDVAVDDDSPRVITYQVARPYRIKTQITREVSVEATARYGRKISERLVRTCWEKMRRERNHE